MKIIKEVIKDSELICDVLTVEISGIKYFLIGKYTRTIIYNKNLTEILSYKTEFFKKFLKIAENKIIELGVQNIRIITFTSTSKKQIIFKSKSMAYNIPFNFDFIIHFPMHYELKAILFNHGKIIFCRYINDENIKFEMHDNSHFMNILNVFFISNGIAGFLAETTMQYSIVSLDCCSYRYIKMTLIESEKKEYFKTSVGFITITNHTTNPYAFYHNHSIVCFNNQHLFYNQDGITKLIYINHIYDEFNTLAIDEQSTIFCGNGHFYFLNQYYEIFYLGYHTISGHMTLVEDMLLVNNINIGYMLLNINLEKLILKSIYCIYYKNFEGSIYNNSFIYNNTKINLNNEIYCENDIIFCYKTYNFELITTKQYTLLNIHKKKTILDDVIISCIVSQKIFLQSFNLFYIIDNNIITSYKINDKFLIHPLGAIIYNNYLVILFTGKKYKVFKFKNIINISVDTNKHIIVYLKNITYTVKIANDQPLLILDNKEIHIPLKSTINSSYIIEYYCNKQYTINLYNPIIVTPNNIIKDQVVETFLTIEMSKFTNIMPSIYIDVLPPLLTIEKNHYYTSSNQYILLCTSTDSFIWNITNSKIIQLTNTKSFLFKYQNKLFICKNNKLDEFIPSQLQCELTISNIDFINFPNAFNINNKAIINHLNLEKPIFENNEFLIYSLQLQYNYSIILCKKYNPNPKTFRIIYLNQINFKQLVMLSSIQINTNRLVIYKKKINGNGYIYIYDLIEFKIVKTCKLKIKGIIQKLIYQSGHKVNNKYKNLLCAIQKTTIQIIKLKNNHLVIKNRLNFNVTEIESGLLLNQTLFLESKDKFYTIILNILNKPKISQDIHQLKLINNNLDTIELIKNIVLNTSQYNNTINSNEINTSDILIEEIKVHNENNTQNYLDDNIFNLYLQDISNFKSKRLFELFKFLNPFEKLPLHINNYDIETYPLYSLYTDNTINRIVYCKNYLAIFGIDGSISKYYIELL